MKKIAIYGKGGIGKSTTTSICRLHSVRMVLRFARSAAIRKMILQTFAGTYLQPDCAGHGAR